MRGVPSSYTRRHQHAAAGETVYARNDDGLSQIVNNPVGHLFFGSQFQGKGAKRDRLEGGELKKASQFDFLSTFCNLA